LKERFVNFECMRHPLLILVVIFFSLSCDKNEDDCEKSQRCELTPEAGPCYAMLSKYYYNAVSGQCEEFIYGGCEGVVPFETLEACYECECDKRLE